MAVKIKFGGTPGSGFLSSPLVRYFLIFILVVVLVGGCIFAYYLNKYNKLVDQMMAHPIFATTAQVYAAPREVRVGQKLTAAAIANELHQAGYNDQPEMGAYQLRNTDDGETIMIKPGPQSYHSPDGATIITKDGEVQEITGENGVPLAAYELEPLLITGMAEDNSRTKRRVLTYNEIPQRLVNAVVAIEDKRFFEHHGIDYIRIVGALKNDIFHLHKNREGASTITQQLAKWFFLTPEQTYSRKLREAVIAIILEHKFNKQQIFEMYANEINVGHLGSFDINGFGEASRAYFGKDVGQLDLAECALLAGIVNSPNRLNPYRHADRAIERRNLVLDTMVDTGAITESEADAARAEPLKLVPENVDASEAPYFVDLVHDELAEKFGDRDPNAGGLRIYTSLDPELQRAAADAVDAEIKGVDDLVRNLHTHHTKMGTVVDENIVYPQVALIALDPHTGQVLALIGGRNYGASQLDHAEALRPTGSIFKPIVYAAAYNASLNGEQINGISGPFTALSRLHDEPTTFTFDDGRQTYSPHNFADEYGGDVTAAYALAHSLNNATISLASMVGYDKVVQLAHDAGIKRAEPTPSMAIGTYEATPIDMAGVYTIFANNGVHITPWFLASVRNPNGDVLADFAPDARQVLDQRVAYLTTSLMEGVLTGTGTGAGVRGMGFTAPAAGKTGTSHDAWFAGFTSNLICVVWVGNDDYTDINLEGAHAAAPIWADFMKRAVLLPQYSDTHTFTPPDGVVDVPLDKNTNLLANDTCTDDYVAAFLDGTQPTVTCSQTSAEPGLIQKIFGGSKPAASAPTATTTQTAPDSDTSPNPTPPTDPNKKPGLMGRIFGSK
jgi:penicillin-binding protein 1B